MKFLVPLRHHRSGAHGAFFGAQAPLQSWATARRTAATNLLSSVATQPMASPPATSHWNRLRCRSRIAPRPTSIVAS